MRLRIQPIDLSLLTKRLVFLQNVPGNLTFPLVTSLEWERSQKVRNPGYQTLKHCDAAVSQTTWHFILRKISKPVWRPHNPAPGGRCTPYPLELRHWNGREVRKFETKAIYLKALRLSRDSNHIRALIVGVRSSAIKRHQDS